MIDDPDVRDVSDETAGEFIGFELFDGSKWTQFGISHSALHILGGPSATSDIDTFERNVTRIKGVAFGIGNVGNGRTMLNSDHFK